MNWRTTFTRVPQELFDARTFSGNPIAQRPEELRQFGELLQRENIRAYIEIGARHGDTLVALAPYLPAGATIIGVDLPGGKWGRIGSDKALSAAVAHLRERGYDAHAVIGDSHSSEVSDFVWRTTFHVDDDDMAVFIDADHTLDGVSGNWERYRHFARVVAFHDIKPHEPYPEQERIEVPALWEKLKQLYGANAVELCEGKKPGMGIGVLVR